MGQQAEHSGFRECSTDLSRGHISRTAKCRLLGKRCQNHRDSLKVALFESHRPTRKPFDSRERQGNPIAVSLGDNTLILPEIQMPWTAICRQLE